MVGYSLLLLGATCPMCPRPLVLSVLPTRKVGGIFEKDVDSPWRIGLVGSKILTMIDGTNLLFVK